MELEKSGSLTSDYTINRALIFNHIVALLPLLPSCGKSGLSHEDAGEAGGAVVLARGDS